MIETFDQFFDELERVQKAIDMERKNFHTHFKRWLRSTESCFERDVLRDCKEQLWEAWKKRANEFDEKEKS